MLEGPHSRRMARDALDEESPSVKKEYRYSLNEEQVDSIELNKANSESQVDSVYCLGGE